MNLSTHVTTDVILFGVILAGCEAACQNNATRRAYILWYYAHARGVHMRVAPVITTFPFYIRLQSLIPGIVVVAQWLGCVVQGCQGFLFRIRRRSSPYIISTDISVQRAFSTNVYTTFTFFNQTFTYFKQKQNCNRSTILV